MNFCGLDEHNVFDPESETDSIIAKSAREFHCGGCVKGVVLEDDDDDDDIEAYLNIDNQLSPVSTTSSCNDHTLTTTDDAATDGTCSPLIANNIFAQKPVVQIALDNIQLAMDDNTTTSNSKEVMVADVVNVDDFCVEEEEDINDDNIRDDEETTMRGRDESHITHELLTNSDNATRNTPFSFGGDNINPLPIVNTWSPSILNPLDLSEWTTEMRDGIETMRRPELLCPILDIHTSSTSPSQETLLHRLEQGFRVRPINSKQFLVDTTLSTDATNNSSLTTMFLHPDRSRICFGSLDIAAMNELQRRHQRQLRTSVSPRFRNQARQLWYGNDPSIVATNGSSSTTKGWRNNSDIRMEIMVTDILRLEIGRQNTKSFSIITRNNSAPERGFIVNHIFEATCVIDREVVVSTLLLLLDQVHNSHRRHEIDEEGVIENDDTTFDWFEGTNGGTMDKPIPCSPSIDIEEKISDAQSIIICSPSVETERIQNLYHYASKNQQRQQQSSMYNTLTLSADATDDETENGDVIHLEDISITDSNASRVLGNWSRRTPSSLCLVQQKSMSTTDEIEDFVRLKASASSTQVFGAGGGASSGNVTNNISQAVWCSGDTCALALNDIAETCTGIFALKQNESICSPTLGVEQRVAVEEFIATALGTSTEVYSYLTEGGDIWNSKSSTPISASKVGKIHRNRATILNAQAARLRGLRNEMTFATALKQSREKMQLVQTVQSFDDAYNRAGTKKLRAATEAANRLHTSPLLQSIINNMKMHDAEGNTNLEEDTNNVVYYDSDPEDSRPHNADRGPRKIVQANKEQRDVSVAGKPVLTKTLDGLEDNITPMKISKKLDEETIVEIVQTMNNERLTLMWHPTQQGTHRSSSPQCVKVWIEAGVYLNDGTFLLPKLTWSKVSAVLSSGLSATTATSLTGAPGSLQPTAKIQYSPTLEKLDLLDICRIYPLTTVNRTLHPFALTQKSFCIETQSEKFVFQAQSIEEKDRIVYGLKLVVARLASLLMLRDIRAAEEFFGAIATTGAATTYTVQDVPGEAPTWTSTIGKSGNSDNTTTETTTLLISSANTYNAASIETKPLVIATE